MGIKLDKFFEEAVTAEGSGKVMERLREATGYSVEKPSSGQGPAGPKM